MAPTLLTFFRQNKQASYGVEAGLPDFLWYNIPKLAKYTK
jgi:hypothetical protein